MGAAENDGSKAAVFFGFETTTTITTAAWVTVQVPQIPPFQL
jgi:hypothetical protein